MQEENSTKNDKRIYTMAKEKPLKAVFKMGLPVTMGMLFMVVYNLTDTYFIGQLHDDNQLAATNLCYPVLMVMIAVAGIVGNGGASYIARCIGAGRTDEARHTLTIGFEMIVGSSVILSAICLLLIDPIVNALGADPDTFIYTKKYAVSLIVGSVFTMGNYAVGQLLRSEGSTGCSMVGMIAGNVVNMILDPIFIFTLRLEITGAAVATVVGNAVGLLIYLLYYRSGKTLLTPSLSMLRPDRKIIGEIFLVGIPHTLEQFFSTAAIIVNNNLASSYGAYTVAAMGVSNKIMSLGNYVYQGMAAGSQPLMGYNYGAKNYSRMKQLFRSGIIAITAMELGIMVLYGFGAEFLVGLFSDTTEVISIGVKTLHAALLMLPFVGTTSLARNTFNSMGKPMFAFGITIVRQLLLYIPFLLIFNKLWGYNGLIHAQPAEEAICMIVSISVLMFYINRLDQNRALL